MSSPSPSTKRRQKLHLKRYLEELGALIGRVVKAEELGSLEEVAAMRQAAQRFIGQPTAKYEINFSDRRSERFKKFLKNLTVANRLAIYVWTPHTIDCGALLVDSLDAISFDFEFAINDDGVLSFMTSDLRDRLLVDFSSTSTGEQVMRIEIQGANWTKVVY